MDFKITLSLLLVGLVVFVGCTACDPNNSNSIELTREVEVLCTPLGWVAQQEYQIGVDETLKYLYFDATEMKGISVCLEDEKKEQIGTTSFEIPKEGQVILDLQEDFDVSYELKITATKESEPILSLANTKTGEKMFFSMGSV